MFKHCITLTLSLCLCASAFNFLSAEEIPITLEIARTSEQRSWGLMQRSSMPDNHGMLFYYAGGNIWMFNMLMDLSIAFLDKKGRIIEIAELRAYPQMMDPNRPVKSANDMSKYPIFDKVYQFFWERSHPAPRNTKYFLEMNKQWFRQHGVRPGDVVLWQVGSSVGFVNKKMD